jgi:nucleoside-diphosphate-sugar epimerase
VLPEFFPQLLSAGVRRVVALSSTSVFTKQDSLDTSEQRLSQEIADAENNFMHWAQAHRNEWVILRPTLIYGSGADKNIAVIAKFIKRFGFFPLCGKASGLRQPIHARDVASACVSALRQQGAEDMDFNLSGAETLTYREMISRVFIACGLKPRLLALPAFVFRFGFFFLRLVPRYRHWSLGMALRMNQDQTCDHSQAASVLGFSPQKFILESTVLPAESQ